MSHPPTPNQGPPKKRPRTRRVLLVSAGLAALLVVGCGVGGSILWRNWSDKAVAGSPFKKDSLARRNPSELRALLPTSKDFEDTWQVQSGPGDAPDLKGANRSYDPAGCGHVFDAADRTVLGHTQALPGDFTSRVEITIGVWRNGSKMAKVNSYAQRCPEYTERDTFAQSPGVATTRYTTAAITPPDAHAESAAAIQAVGVETDTWNGNSTMVTVHHVNSAYAADVRGLLVWVNCKSADRNKGICEKVFADVVAKLARL